MALPPKQQYAQFLSQANLAAQQKLVKGYYQQLIRMYGITVKYFRKNYEFFDPNGLLNTDGNVDWTYGYDSDYSYGNETDMIGYIEMGNDAFIFSMVGADAEQDGKIFFTKEQFELDMLNAVGVVTSGHLSATIPIDVSEWYGTYDHTEVYDDFQIQFKGDIDITPGSLPISITPDIEDISTDINEDISGTKSYVSNWLVQGSISGVTSGALDLNGDGSINLYAEGDVVYNTPASTAASNGWGIAPQVGDFIRITFGDGTTEDFSFTQVTDRDLQNDGISPFLGKFVWKCQFTRKNYTYEDVPSGSISREQSENDFLDQVINIQDNVSDDHYDYDVETDADDDVYGGF